MTDDDGGHPPPSILVSDRQDAPLDQAALISIARDTLIAEGHSQVELSLSFVTDAEIAVVDAAIRRTTTEKFGPVRSVKPTMVFEIGFEGIARSSRHKAGIAVRFPRMLRIRDDKKIEEADTLATLQGMLP